MEHAIAVMAALYAAHEAAHAATQARSAAKRREAREREARTWRLMHRYAHRTGVEVPEPEGAPK